MDAKSDKGQKGDTKKRETKRRASVYERKRERHSITILLNNCQLWPPFIKRDLCRFYIFILYTYILSIIFSFVFVFFQSQETKKKKLFFFSVAILATSIVFFAAAAAALSFIYTSLKSEWIIYECALFLLKTYFDIYILFVLIHGKREAKEKKNGRSFLHRLLYGLGTWFSLLKMSSIVFDLIFFFHFVKGIFFIWHLFRAVVLRLLLFFLVPF